MTHTTIDSTIFLKFMYGLHCWHIKQGPSNDELMVAQWHINKITKVPDRVEFTIDCAMDGFRTRLIECLIVSSKRDLRDTTGETWELEGYLFLPTFGKQPCPLPIGFAFTMCYNVRTRNGSVKVEDPYFFRNNEVPTKVIIETYDHYFVGTLADNSGVALYCRKDLLIGLGFPIRRGSNHKSGFVVRMEHPLDEDRILSVMYPGSGDRKKVSVVSLTMNR